MSESVLALFYLRGRLPAGRRPCEANFAPRFALRSPPLKHWRVLARFRAKQALTVKQTQTSLNDFFVATFGYAHRTPRTPVF